MKVKNGTMVSIRYRIMNSKKEVIENLMNGSAISYLHGGLYITRFRSRIGRIKCR